MRRLPSLLRPLLPLAAVAVAQAQAPAAAPAAAAATPSQTVVVTATRHPTLLTDVPAAMSVVTREDIEARGADNVLEAIRGEPGVSLQGRSIGGRKVISLRGMDSTHTLFLVDGRRVAASDSVVGHSDFQYDWIAVDDIERIEVVRGPLSVLYGSEAMGGVVNVITRRPGEQWRFGARAEGSWAEGGRGGDGWRLGAQAAGPLGGGFTLSAGAARTALDPLASTADPRISELEGREKRDGWLALGWSAAAGHQVDLELREGREERQADARERTGLRRYHETVNELERALRSIGWQTDWGGAGALSTQLRAYRASLAVENLRTPAPDMPAQPPVAANPPQRVEDEVLEGQARFDVARQGVTAGFEARNESLEDPGLPGGRSVARHRALFAQDEFALGPALQATLGLRYDSHQLYGQEWSPRAYLVWRVDAAWTVKGGYSHGFKAPNLKQIVPGARREGPNTFLGNPDLQPETSDGIELGAGYAAGGRQLQLMLFDQRVDDLIEVKLLAPGPVPGTGTYTYANLARARLRGLEVSLEQALAAGFAATLNYSFLDAEDGDGKPLERRPRNSAGAWLDWSGGPWRSSLRAEYSGGEVQSGQTLPGVTLLGAYLARKLPAGFELALGVDNLSDVNLAEKSPLFTRVEPPRTWRLTLRGAW